MQNLTFPRQMLYLNGIHGSSCVNHTKIDYNRQMQGFHRNHIPIASYTIAWKKVNLIWSQRYDSILKNPVNVDVEAQTFNTTNTLVNILYCVY